LKQDDEVNSDGTIHNQWRLCSVQQVEDFKAVIRIIPLVLAILFLSTPIAMQLGLTVLQGLVMDRRLGPHFKIPAGSLQVITLLSTCLFIIVNDRFLYPFYQKLTGKFPTPIQRVGIGHVFNILSMAVTAIVEAKRLKIVQKGHFLGSSSVADMSVLWLFPPLVIVGIGKELDPDHFIRLRSEFHLFMFLVLSFGCRRGLPFPRECSSVLSRVSRVYAKYCDINNLGVDWDMFLHKHCFDRPDSKDHCMVTR